MNNKNTNLMDLLLNKFPKGNIINNTSFCSKFTSQDLKTFLSLNSYNETLVSETDTDLFFKNLNTEKVSIAHITDSKMSNSPSIEFAPYFDYNEFRTVLNSKHFDEAIAFSICNSHFICVRINKNGMFIEDYFKGDAISTELYDVYAIKSIIDKGYYELYDNNKILFYLLDNLKSSVEDLSFNIKEKLGLYPDTVIKCCDYQGTFKAVFEKSGIEIYRDSFDFSNIRQFYAQFLRFMKERDYYSDVIEKNYIRIRRNIN